MRIAVLGAGIVGVATAEWLRRDGHEVTLVDRRAPGDPGQASYGNAGVLANSSVVPVPVPGLLAKAPAMLLDPDGPLFLRWGYLPRLAPWLARFLGSARRVAEISTAIASLVSDTAEAHHALAAGTGAERHLADGRFTFLYRDRDAWVRDRLGRALRRAAGLEAEELDRAALLAEDPELGPAQGFGVRHAGGGHVSDPGAYARDLFAHFRREGGAFRPGEVVELAPLEGGVAIALAGQGRLSADRAVLAMGAWSAPLAERLGHRVRLESERGYHLTLEGASHRPPAPYMLADAKFAASPMADGLRLAGLVEFGGLRAGPSSAPLRLIRRRLSRLYPRLTWEGEREWLGHRPSTADSLPFIGEAPKAPGVFFAFGAQHLGLTTAPKTGRLIADLIGGRRPNLDLAPFRVGRFDR